MCFVPGNGPEVGRGDKTKRTAEKYANRKTDVAHLVERKILDLEVAGSNPVIKLGQLRAMGLSFKFFEQNKKPCETTPQDFPPCRYRNVQLR